MDGKKRRLVGSLCYLELDHILSELKIDSNRGVLIGKVLKDMHEVEVNKILQRIIENALKNDVRLDYEDQSYILDNFPQIYQAQHDLLKEQNAELHNLLVDPLDKFKDIEL